MPITALLASNTGLQAASLFLDVTSNNIANSTTPGFKTQQTTFQDLLYVGNKPGATTSQGVTPPIGTQVGVGTAIDATTGLFTQGPLQQTDSQFDLGINGEGFFAVTLPDGSLGYTRAGNFTTDVTGTLVSSDGFRLAGGITLPTGTTSVSISTSGAVTATTAAGAQQVGNITLTRFTNPAGLTRVGDTTFAVSPSSGDPITGTPGANGLGTISQGFLEQSNVDIASELINLLIAQRTFSFNSQAIEVETAVLDATTSLIP